MKKKVLNKNLGTTPNPLFDLDAVLFATPAQHGDFYLLPGTEASDFNNDVLSHLFDSVKGNKVTHYVTKGAWDMHELTLLLLEITGAANVFISTYAMSEIAARTLCLLKESGHIKTLHCLIDDRVDVRSAGSLQLLTSICDHISLASCHAKVTVIEGSKATVTVVGSANYTENKRYEAGIIDKTESVAIFHKSWIQNAIDNATNKPKSSCPVSGT